MSTFLLIPLNEQGAFTDTSLVQALHDATGAAAQFSDVFFFSHGWWTNANAAMVDYDRFTAGFDRALGTDPTTRQLARQAMGAFLSTGVHWPSVLTEDPGSVLNYLQASSYFTMRERADDVGVNGGYAILQSAIPTAAARAARVNLIGHSFGCRVVCSALSKFLASLGPTALPNVRFNVVLIQAAFDQKDLSPDGSYQTLLSDARVRLLITKSAKDWSLSDGYPVANLVWDVVNHTGFASVAKDIPEFLQAAAKGAMAPAALAGQLAERFVHVHAATPGQQPNLAQRFQALLPQNISALGGNLENLGMDLVKNAADALGHDIPRALGAEGPLPAVITHAGAQHAPVTLDVNWPGAPPAGTPITPAQIQTASGALSKAMVVADLAPLHTAREPVAWPGRDHHSDINALEIYRLVAGFLLA